MTKYPVAFSLDRAMTPKSQTKLILPAALAKALNGQTPSTDSGSLLKHIMQRWGGPEALANDLYTEFRKAPEGGAIRKSILELIQRLVIQTTEAGIENAIRPADLDDTALDGMVMHYVARLQTPLAPASYGTHDEPPDEPAPDASPPWKDAP